MIHIALIDDDPLVRDVIKFLLEGRPEHYKLVLESPSMGHFFEHLQLEDKLDILILDVSLEEGNSLEHLGKLKQLLPDVRVIISTGHDDPGFFLEALRKGASSYIVKGAGNNRLLDVIQATYEGGAYLEPKLAPGLVSLISVKKETAVKGVGYSPLKNIDKMEIGLHQREVQVINGLAQGHTYKEIASNNYISINTVRHYVKSIYRKLGVSGKEELLAYLNSL